MDSSDTTRSIPEPSRFYEATFASSTAADAADTLLVFIPSISLDQPFGDPDGVVWSPNGATLPQEGDQRSWPNQTTVPGGSSPGLRARKEP
jgi:hypothetical protein